MATLKAIRKRIVSIRNTQQITKAMKMVSAAKLRRAQEAVVQARPYAEKVAALLKNLSARVAQEAHPLLMQREEKRVDLWLLTADRGLCGGYNANLIRAAEGFLRVHGREKEIQLAVVGRKGVDYFRRRRVEMIARYPNAWSRSMGELAAEIAEQMIGRFVRGETDGAYILYSRFRSALSQVPTLEKLVPAATAAEQREELPVEYLFEPDVRTLLASLLPKVVEVGIYRALLEAVASEHGARMTAMDSATTNAADMISSLTLQMNRARQASITRELMEIVSTAEALK
ncbi:MAG: ATP synthase F1 subunit gamma [Deltaproteobacteria bacterium GWA2_57_13]|nr:MAG: ATP synthase F1 subunit gamma [Deltaproteobacteria bacterium GWA2_57_13]OGQ50424.1 MAG: ATP synthase F1 subunit gamma [Deltaproteobacteria bacterium RIFCSPLOWO2_02_FULL_57_26]OGQ73835.1 MAG: ATP synthase F1 subunit gamma [Deltaproteobacteria bacterium RIFCSPLOWO2_12_FULL_57_22]